MRTTLLFLVSSCPALCGQVDPSGRSILFIRGADGSGGLGQGNQQYRTEHLSDINNTSTAPGNHGFGQLAARLRQDGFTVSQWIESQGILDFNRLKPHRIVVFGSNNRVYSAAEIAALHQYFDAGGSALFMSDANWGADWSAAPASDNQFLARYGAAVYQDSADGVPVMSRSTTGRFVLPGHATLSGPDGAGGDDDVASYEGEGVSYFSIVPTHPMRPRHIVSAAGFQVRLITATGNAGPKRAAGPNDVAMFGVTKGNATIVGHFDRNTFFNANGTGSDITRRDHGTLALNLFRFLASIGPTVRTVGAPCSNTLAPMLSLHPAIPGPNALLLTGARAGRFPITLLSPGKAKPARVPRGCVVQPDLAFLLPLPMGQVDMLGRSLGSLRLPNLHVLCGVTITLQALYQLGGGRLLDSAELSSGVEATLGYPR